MLVLFLVFAVVFEAGSGQMVRQCTCAELDQCKQRAMEEIAGCALECRTQMKPTDAARAQAAMQCIGGLRNGGNDVRECFSSLRDRICTNRPGTMIPSQSEGFGPFGGMGGMGGGGGGFFQALRQRFMGGGEMQEAHPFLFCMKQCRQRMSGGQQLPPMMACQRQLGCSILKPSMFEMFQVMGECRARIQAKKQMLCDCLVRSGQEELCQALQNHQGPGIFG